MINADTQNKSHLKSIGELITNVISDVILIPQVIYYFTDRILTATDHPPKR